jgi:thiol-disulfide isomerase/thioredoxin
MIGINSFAQFEFEIKGNVYGKDEGTLFFVELGTRVGDQVEIPFKNGKFLYKGIADGPIFYFLSYFDTVTRMIGQPSEIILGPGETEIEIYLDGNDLGIIFIRPNEMNLLLQQFIGCSKFYSDTISKISNQAEITQLMSQQADSMYSLSIANANNILSMYILYFYYDRFSDLQISNIILEMDPTYRTDKYFKIVDSKFAGKSFNYVGDRASDFTLKDRIGTNISLSEIVNQNNYVLLDFWGSWCGPCIKKARAIIPIYDKYNSKGFEIFGVALETKRDRWIQAIDSEGYKWINVIELENDKSQKYFITKLYNVDEYPFNLLLDRNMKIIAKNVTSEELEKLLGELY